MPYLDASIGLSHVSSLYSCLQNSSLSRQLHQLLVLLDNPRPVELHRLFNPTLSTGLWHDMTWSGPLLVVYGAINGLSLHDSTKVTSHNRHNVTGREVPGQGSAT